MNLVFFLGPLLACSIYFYHGFLLIINYWFDYTLYVITEKEKKNHLSSKIVWSSLKKYDTTPYGFFISFYWYGFYCGFIYGKGGEEEILLFCSSALFKELTSCKKEKTIDDIEKKIEIKIVERTSMYYRLEYTIRDFNISKYIANEKQRPILDTIVTTFKNSLHNVCVSFVYGPPGKGKSMMGLLLAKELGGSFTTEFNPSDPGDTFSNLRSKVQPTPDKPLIVLIDEVNIMIKKVHNESIERHKDIAIEISDKRGWNAFFDKIHHGCYPNCIFLLTSNVPITEINKWDNSYLRKGRVDTVHTLD